VLFGDGAGAVVLQATDAPSGVLSFVLGSDGSGAEHLILKAGGTAIPASHEALVNRQHYLHMNGREVFKFATRVLGKSLRQAIAESGLTPEDIDLVIPHQANSRIIESAARQIRLPMDKFFLNTHKYGNTSAASIPIALCEALEEGRAKVGDTLAFVSFGAGLTWAATVVKIVEKPVPAPSAKRSFPLLRWLKRE
jgi:3-oxoacyl-[acyl-carrier-protein] synthase-3